MRVPLRFLTHNRRPDSLSAEFLYRFRLLHAFLSMNLPPRDPASAFEVAAATAEVQRLFLKHSGAIKGFILALLRNTSLAEDVLQETFLVVSAKAESFRPGSNFVAWACTIARFKTLEAIRKQAPQLQALRENVIEALAADRPEENNREEVLRCLEHCMAELPSSAREAIHLRYFHSLLPEEIGLRLSLKIDSVYVTLTRARKTLRRCVDGKLARQESASP